MSYCQSLSLPVSHHHPLSVTVRHHYLSSVTVSHCQSRSLKSILVLPPQIFGLFGPPKKHVNFDKFNQRQVHNFFVLHLFVKYFLSLQSFVFSALWSPQPFELPSFLVSKLFGPPKMSLVLQPPVAWLLVLRTRVNLDAHLLLGHMIKVKIVKEVVKGDVLYFYR